MLSIGPAATFHDKTNAYGALGLFIAETSALEFALDTFMFKFHELYKDAAVTFSKNAPQKIGDKLEFYVSCLINFPILRRIPFWDIELNINAICYRVEEIFDIRNHLAHGAIDLTEISGGASIYTAVKYTRRKSGSYGVDRYTIGSGFLESVWNDCKSTRKYFQNLSHALDDPDFLERNCRLQKEIVCNRVHYRELMELLGASPLIKGEVLDGDEITIKIGGPKIVAVGGTR